MNKKYIGIGIAVLVVIAAIAAGVLYSQSSSRSMTASSTEPVVKIGSTTAEVILPPAVISEYMKSLNLPEVKHMRDIVTLYSNGKSASMNASERHMAVDLASSNANKCGLDAFSKDYFKSKFYLFSIADSPVGGKMVSVLFADKPDKVFTSWVYPLEGGKYEVRNFCEDNTYTPEQLIKQFLVPLKSYLAKPEFSL